MSLSDSSTTWANLSLCPRPGMKERLLQRGLGLGSGDLHAVELENEPSRSSQSWRRPLLGPKKALAGAFSRRCETSRRFVGSSNPQWRHCSVSGLEWCLVSLCPAPVLPFLSMLLALASPASALQDSVVLGAGTTGHPMLVTEAFLRPKYTAARNGWWPSGK